MCQVLKWLTNNSLEILSSDIFNYCKATDDLQESHKFDECCWTVKLAQHLLSQLAIGSTYTIDSHSQKLKLVRKNHKEYLCPCSKGEMMDGSFGDTSFGCVAGWHGSVDILMENIPVTIVGNEAKSDSPSSESSNDGNDSAIEIKYSEGFCSKDINQVIAQCIAFAFLQKKKCDTDKKYNKNMTNYLIPSLGISKKYVTAIFYDCEQDFLLKTSPVKIFNNSGQKNIFTIVFIWLTLNYKWFCSGVTRKEFPKLLEADFKKLAVPMYTRNVHKPAKKPHSNIYKILLQPDPEDPEVDPDRVRRFKFVEMPPHGGGRRSADSRPASEEEYDTADNWSTVSCLSDRTDSIPEEELDFKRKLELEKKHQQIQREISQLEDKDALTVAAMAAGGPCENFKIEKKMTGVSISDPDSAIEDRHSRDRKRKMDIDEPHWKHKKKMTAKKHKDNQSDNERSPESEHISPEFVKEKKRKQSKGRTKSRSSSRDRSRSYSPETRESRKVEKKKKGKREEYSEKPHMDTSFEKSRDTKNRTGTPVSDNRDLSPEPEVVKKKKEKKKDRKKKERDLSVGGGDQGVKAEDELVFKRELELEKKRQQIQRELSQLEDKDALTVATTAAGGPCENFKIEKKMTGVSISDQDSAIEDRRSRDRKRKKKKNEKRSKHSRSPMKVKLRSPSPGLDIDEPHRKHKKKMTAKKHKDNQSDSERSPESEHISHEFVKESKRSKGRTKSRSSSRDRSRSYSPETRESRKVEKKKKGKREEYSEKPHMDTSFEKSRDTKNRTGTPVSDNRDLSPEPEVVKKKKEKKKDRKKKERDLSVGGGDQGVKAEDELDFKLEKKRQQIQRELSQFEDKDALTVATTAAGGPCENFKIEKKMTGVSISDQDSAIEDRRSRDRKRKKKKNEKRSKHSRSPMKVKLRSPSPGLDIDEPHRKHKKKMTAKKHKDNQSDSERSPESEHISHEFVKESKRSKGRTKSRSSSRDRSRSYSPETRESRKVEKKKKGKREEYSEKPHMDTSFEKSRDTKNRTGTPVSDNRDLSPEPEVVKKKKEKKKDRKKKERDLSVGGGDQGVKAEDELDFKLEKKRQQIQRELSQFEDKDALTVAMTAAGGPCENFKIEKKMTGVSSSDPDSAIEDRCSRDRKRKKKKNEKRSKHSRSPMKVKLRSPSPGLDIDEPHRKHKKKMTAKKHKDNQSDSERSPESEHISHEFVKESKRSKGRTKSRSSSRDRSRSYSPETRESRKVEKKKKGKREEYSEKPHTDTSFEKSRDTKNRTGTPASDYRDLSPEPEVVKKKKEKKKDRKKKERDLSVDKEEYERKHKKEKGGRVFHRNF